MCWSTEGFNLFHPVTRSGLTWKRFTRNGRWKKYIGHTLQAIPCLLFGHRIVPYMDGYKCCRRCRRIFF